MAGRIGVLRTTSTENETSIDLAYKQFKNGVRGYKISHKAKSRLFTDERMVRR